MIAGFFKDAFGYPNIRREHAPTIRRGVLADLLPYDVFLGEDEQVVGTRVGGMVAGFRYVGPDLELASPERASIIAQSMSRALEILEEGDVVHFEVFRQSTGRSSRPEIPSDAPRSLQAMAQLEPSVRQVEERTYLFIGRNYRVFRDPQEHLEGFEDSLRRLARFLEDAGCRIERLVSAALFSGLMGCSQFRMGDYSRPIEVFLDQGLAVDSLRSDGRGGLQLGDRHWALVRATGLRDGLDCGFADRIRASRDGGDWGLRGTPYPVRYVTRLVIESQSAAEARIDRRRNEFQFSSISLVGELYKRSSAAVAANLEEDAELRVGQAIGNCREALEASRGRGARFGLVSSYFWVEGEDADSALKNARDLRSRIERLGYSGRLADTNLVDAYQGCLPGEDRRDLYLMQLPFDTFAGMLTLGSPWSGHATCGHSKAPELPPLMLTERRTGGGLLFSIFGSMEVSDELGHTVVAGGSGAGKTVFVNKLIWRSLLWPGSQVLSLDNGHSQAVLAAILGDDAKEVILGEGYPMAPFAALGEGPDKSATAEAGMVFELLHQLGIEITPGVRREVSAGLDRLARLDRPLRTLANLRRQIQSRAVRGGIDAYLSGAYRGFLDGTPSEQDFRRLYVYEISGLAKLDSKISAPIVLDIFLQMERLLDGRRFKLIVVEELHTLLGRSRFITGFSEALRLWRKQRGALILVGHEPKMLTEGPISEAIESGVGTKIALPNPAASRGREHREAYFRLGFSESETDSIAVAKPKSEYLYRQGPDRSVWMKLPMSDFELAVLGSSAAEAEDVRQRRRRDGKHWLDGWCRDQGVPDRESRLFRDIVDGRVRVDG